MNQEVVSYIVLALLECPAVPVSHTLVKTELFIYFSKTRLIIYNLGCPGTCYVTKTGFEVAATLLPLSLDVSDVKNPLPQVPSNPNGCAVLVLELQ